MHSTGKLLSRSLCNNLFSITSCCKRTSYATWRTIEHYTMFQHIDVVFCVWITWEKCLKRGGQDVDSVPTEVSWSSIHYGSFAPKFTPHRHYQTLSWATCTATRSALMTTPPTIFLAALVVSNLDPKTPIIYTTHTQSLLYCYGGLDEKGGCGGAPQWRNL